MEESRLDVIVIGAGVVGALTARELARYRLRVLVIEKENDVGNGVSMANSAIIHSGYDPEPGTAKAKFNVLGNRMFPKLLEELDVPHVFNGSLTVALSDEEVKTLAELGERSALNGVPYKLLNREETLKLEPNLSSEVRGSLFAPTAGVADPFALTVHAMENAVDNGVTLHLCETVIGIERLNGYHKVITDKKTYEARFVINCAGLHSDEIHRMIEPIDYEIRPRKGEYYVLDRSVEKFVSRVIFPLPSKKGKGILIAPTTAGNYILGPSSDYVASKDDLATDGPTLQHVKESVLRLVPSIPFGKSIRVFAGLRPTPSTHDFIIGFAKSDDGFINAAGIESPGLASSPAIADYIVNTLLASRMKLERKENFDPCVRKRIDLKLLSLEERNALIKKDHAYGDIVCFCEQISLGEILDEFRRSVPPRTFKALKKRTRVGFGKCQAGFCQARALMIIAKQLGIPLDKVLYDGPGSEIMRYENKKGALR